MCKNPYSIWLDSSDSLHRNSRFSFVMAYPFEKIHSNQQTNLWEYLKNHPLFNVDNTNNKLSHDLNIPFTGGFAGFISYDYAVADQFNLEQPKTILNIPKFYGGLYDLVLYADHSRKQAGIISNSKHPDLTSKDRLEAFLDQYDHLKWSDDDIFKKNVQKVVDYIHDGDIFQANIARYIQAQRPNNFNSLDFYQRLRTVNPAPFGCYIHDDNFQIMSASPERFLNIQDRKITAEPIKGTIKSAQDSTLDQKQRDILLNCPKNRAENIMIVDLLRNDITKHAQAGSIKVEKLCELHSFRNLHHLISSISGQMQPQAHAIDVIRDALPGGSITGAPKKRVCEIIYELEKTQRHAYCGTAGYIGFNGNADMNILIRTVQADKKSLIIHSGCGITAQSDPEDEYQETITKIQKIL